jgi:hypothetical protein
MAASEAGATAQDAYRLMLREHIAPMLRELGFRRGPSAGAFRHETATHAAEVRFAKSRLSTRRRVDFGVYLLAADITAGRVYWDYPLSGLAHCHPWWTVTAGGQVEPVARSVLQAFHGYGWPAIQAALDDPGYPPDPAVHWARAFPPLPQRPLTAAEDAAIWRTRSKVYHTSKWRRNDPFALLEILEKDPLAGERESAARRLIPWASTEEVSHALRSAATEDEDVRVRWASRYALRLADRQTSAG